VLRVGYAVTTSRTARLLEFHQIERNINAVGARAAALALDDTAHVAQSVRRNTDDRQEFVNQIHARGLRAIASQTNFVMLDTERPAHIVIDHMQQHRIVLPPTFLPFENHVRVSLGTRAEMTEFWRVWDLMPRVSVHRM
jgi:histidinol-phosphate aminotransferase